MTDNQNDYDLAEELNRKVLETIQIAETRYEKGEILQRDYVTTLNTVNSAALGLYDDEVAAAVSEILATITISPVTHRHTFLGSNGIVYVTSYVEGSCQMLIKKVVDGAVSIVKDMNYEDEIEGQLMALSQYRKANELLESKYEKI